MVVVYIHGANSTPTSFNYITSKIGHKSVFLEYNSNNSFYHNLAVLKKEISTIPEPFFFVAHSLGGVYALHLATSKNKYLQGAVTISTPYGGSLEADLLRIFLPTVQLFADIGVKSSPIISLSNFDVPSNWTNIVTTAGNSPLISADNDGVVSVASMSALANKMELLQINSSHYEVLQSNETVNIIQSKINV